MPANPKVGFFALSNAAATIVNVVFDWWQIDGPERARSRAACPARTPIPVIASVARTPTRRRGHRHGDRFTAAATDADGDPLTYAWDFGDTAPRRRSRTRRTRYTTPGTYTAKVTVSDGKGGTDSQTLPIVVTQANRAPTVTGRADAHGRRRPGHVDRLHRDRHRR